MSYRTLGRSAFGALGLIALATSAANAGGFALREQSAYGQGASFAGIAAGGALSSMFWNPATVTQFRGITSETVLTGVLPHTSHSFTTATDAAAGGAGNSGINTLVPAGYTSYQVSDRLWVALSTNAPFGLGVHFPQVWAGGRGGSGESAKLTTYNFSPTVAYKINEMFSVAVGLQAQYMQASYDAQLSPAPGSLIGTLNGGGWNFGWTAGLTFNPWMGTQIGVGYRSAIDQKLSGTWAVPAPASATTQPGSVNLTIPLPATLTVGLRQAIGNRFTLLAGFEWANWSRIGTDLLLQPSGAQVTLGVPPNPVTFPFQYKDGYFYSLGGEYMIDPSWTVRAGIGYEKSPISDNVRTVRIPDNDRMWYSVGTTYKPAFLKNFSFDLGYSFIDVKNAPICMGVLSGCPTNPWSGAATYVGSVSSYINIISLGIRYQFGAEPAPARLITKG
jgi:long-chain fatty acid transport protein